MGENPSKLRFDAERLYDLIIKERFIPIEDEMKAWPGTEAFLLGLFVMKLAFEAELSGGPRAREQLAELCAYLEEG